MKYRVERLFSLTAEFDQKIICFFEKKAYIIIYGDGAAVALHCKEESPDPIEQGLLR